MPHTPASSTTNRQPAMAAPARTKWQTRTAALLAATLATGLAGCNAEPTAEDLLAFVFFRADAAHAATSPAPKLHSNITVMKNNNACLYIVSWDDPSGNATTRTQLQLHFSPTSKLTIQRTGGTGYVQEISNAPAILRLSEPNSDRTIHKNLNATYGDAQISSFDDDQAERAVASFDTFIKTYCPTETTTPPYTPTAGDLLTFAFFHADPAHPETNQAPLPANLIIEKTSNCHYQIAWDEPSGTFTKRTQYNVAFQPTSKLRIQPEAPGYWQHIDGASGTLTQIDAAKNQLFNQKYGATYDDLMRNRFTDDGLGERAVAAFQTFIQRYCTAAR